MRNMIPSRSLKRAGNGSHGRQTRGSCEPTFNPPNTVAPGAPDTSSGMCNEYAAPYSSAPEPNPWNLPTVSNDANVNYLTPCTASLPVETEDDDPVPVRSEHDPSLHVVVKDGYTFYIRYVDEPITEQQPLVQRNHGEGFGAVESLPSISNELSLLMDDSMLPEGAISTLEPAEGSPRDWINYDELPLLTQRKQQPASTDHVSCGTLGAKKKCHTAMEKASEEYAPAADAGDSGCEMFPALGNGTQLALEGFAQINDTILMNGGASSLVTMVPDFSHYCVECEKFFPSNDGLQQHMESNHRLFDEAEIAMTSTPKASFSQAGRYGPGGLVWPCTAPVDSTNHCRKRLFFCDSCNISFDVVESYHLHNHSVHGAGGGGGVGTGYR